jgi:membrane protease YdiL (CAAX protease family)
VFALIREWRGSLIGPIVAHAVHNGFVITLILLVFSK